jgi:uncharacterized protein YhaN
MREPNGVEHTARFGRGLGVILGGSESGKTRLASVLFETLFGPRVGCRTEGCPPVSGGVAWAEVTFHIGRRRFLLRQGFLRGSVLLVEERADGGSTKKVWFKGTSSDPGHEAAWRRALHGLLGVSDGGAWADSGFVLQGDLTLRPGSTGNPGGEGGGHPEAREALAVLEAEHRTLVGGAGSSRPGTLEETLAELEQRRGEAAQWEERAAQLWSLEEERARLEVERAQAERESAEQEEMLQNLKRFEELTQDRTRLEENLGQLRGEQNRIRKQVEAVEAGEARLEADFADFLDAPGDLEECVHAWSESATRLRDVEMDLARVEDAAASLPRSHARRTGLLAAAALGALVWLACLGADAKTVGFILSPLFAGGGYGAVWYLDRNAQRLRLRQEQDLVRLSAEHDEVARREREARSGLGRLSRLDDPSALRAAYRRYTEARGALDRARTARDSHRPLLEVVDAYEQVFADLQLLDTQTRDLVARARYLSGLDANAQVLAVEMDKARSRGEAARARCAWAAEVLVDVQGDMARLESEVPAPGWLAEDLARLEARAERLERRAEATRIAADVLQECMREFQDEFLDRLAERASVHLAALTDGRFTGVRFGGVERMEARQAAGEWCEDIRLSGVTRSALHLAVRIAIAEGVSGDRALPIVLDEPCAAWDEERLAGAHRAFAALARAGRQVVVLSADERLAGWEATWERLTAASPGNEEGHRRAA